MRLIANRTRLMGALAAAGAVAILFNTVRGESALLQAGDEPDASRGAKRVIDHATASQAKLIEQLIDASDHAHYDGRIVQALADRGMAAAMATLSALDEKMPHRRAMVYEVIGLAGRSRGWHPELLRRYDKDAYRIFYEPPGVAEQERIAACLAWEPWDRAYVDALVRAAPVPTLKWLRAQAASPKPSVERVMPVMMAWGVWVRQQREMHHAEDVRTVTAMLFANEAIRTNATALAALVRVAGDCRAGAATSTIAELLLNSPEVAVRSEASAALGKLGGAVARDALMKCLASEQERIILSRASGVLENWPDDDAVGAALLSLFDRTREPSVRRAILFSATKGRWKERDAMIEKALASDDGGVVGTGLQAFAAKPAPKSAEAVVSIATDTRQVQAGIVDAIAAIADPQTTLLLASWLKKESNPSIMIKIVVGLRANGDARARKALLEVAESSDQAMVVEQAILALDALGDEAVLPLATRLAEDRAAPLGVRLQAILALGRFDKPESKDVLARLRAKIDEAFAEPKGDEPVKLASYERYERARLYLAMARVRQGDKAAAQELADLFDAGTTTSQYYTLFLLGWLKIDHPIITRGLRSGDFSLLLAAVRSATQIDAAKYRAEIERIESAPFLRAIRESGIDSLNFRDVLREALKESAAKKQEGN